MNDYFYDVTNDPMMRWEGYLTEYAEIPCPNCKTEVVRLKWYTLLNLDRDYVCDVVEETCPNPDCGRHVFWQDIEFDHVRRPENAKTYREEQVPNI